MRRKLLVTVMVACLVLACVAAAAEAPPVIKPDETIQALLDGYRGKRVTIRLQGGEELIGTVRSVTRELLHLEEVSRREFYDAYVATQKIDAIIVRAREK